MVGLRLSSCIKELSSRINTPNRAGYISEPMSEIAFIQLDWETESLRLF